MLLALRAFGVRYLVLSYFPVDTSRKEQDFRPVCIAVVSKTLQSEEATDIELHKLDNRESKFEHISAFHAIWGRNRTDDIEEKSKKHEHLLKSYTFFSNTCRISKQIPGYLFLRIFRPNPAMWIKVLATFTVYKRLLFDARKTHLEKTLKISFRARIFHPLFRHVRLTVGILKHCFMIRLPFYKCMNVTEIWACWLGFSKLVRCVAEVWKKRQFRTPKRVAREISLTTALLVSQLIAPLFWMEACINYAFLFRVGVQCICESSRTFLFNGES